MGWAVGYNLSTTGWTLVHDAHVAPSWNAATEIRLHVPVHVLPHHTRALFVHSDLPDDLGVQYMDTRAYRGAAPGAEEVCGQDAAVRLLSGLGFTGSAPFEGRGGWNYRQASTRSSPSRARGASELDRLSPLPPQFRGPAGAVSYAAQPARWTLPRHALFPTELQLAVREVLLASVRPESPLSTLPTHLLFRILEACHWDWAVPPGVTPPRAAARMGEAGAAVGAGSLLWPPLYDGDGEEEEEEEWDDDDIHSDDDDAMF